MSSPDSKPPSEGEKPKGDETGWKLPSVGVKGTTPTYDKTKNYGSMDTAEEYASDKKPSFAIETGPFYEVTKESGDVYNNKTSPDDKSFISALHGERELILGKISVNPDKAKASITVVEGKIKGSVVHAEIDFVDKVKEWLGIAPPAAVAPFAARLGDMTSHLDKLFPGFGSPDVLIGWQPAWRTVVDIHACTKWPPPHIGGVVMKGAENVLINHRMACRVGDIVVEIAGGPNPIVEGCMSVMIGTAAPPPKDNFALKGSIDFLTAEASAEVKADVDLTEGSVDMVAKGGAMVAVAKADAEGSFNITIPFTGYHFKIGGRGEVAALTAGLEGEASLKVNQVDPKTGKHQLFSTKLGGKVGAGLLGGGLGFSLGIEED